MPSVKELNGLIRAYAFAIGLAAICASMVLFFFSPDVAGLFFCAGMAVTCWVATFDSLAQKGVKEDAVTLFLGALFFTWIIWHNW